jgi:hypothetical protein
MTGRAPRSVARAPQIAGRPYMFPAMFIPLICGLVGFILFAVFMGWVMDADRHGDSEKH